MRRVWALSFIGVLVASCAAGDRAAVTVVDSQRSPSGTAETSDADSLPTVEELDAAGGIESSTSGGFAGEPYAFTVTVTIDDVGRSMSVAGKVDPEQRIGMMEGRSIEQAGGGWNDEVESTASIPT